MRDHSFWISRPRPYCCYISDAGEECLNNADWSLWWGPDPYEGTDVCTEHIGPAASETEGPVHVYPISMSIAKEA
jgi:hypothetical protein